MKKIPLSIPQLSGNEWKYVKECLDTSWVSSAGNFVDQFEKEIAKYTGSKYAISCVNGTSALQVSLKLADVLPGDEVIVPTLTFIAPINAVSYNAAKPIFMDNDDYYTIDVNKTIEFLNKKSSRRVLTDVEESQLHWEIANAYFIFNKEYENPKDKIKKDKQNLILRKFKNLFK